MTAGTSEGEKSAVLFLGMHRSGTSATAGVFSRLGVDLGSDLLSASADNPKGFYEHRGIVSLHDEVLAALESSWDDPRPLPAGWERDPRLAPLRDRLRTILLGEFSGKPLWGFKDPRLCRLLPFWLPLLDRLRVRAKFVLVVRHPSDASRSLRSRNGMSQEQSSMLWLHHTVFAEQKTREFPRTVLFYDDLLHDWRGESARVRRELELDLCALSWSTTHEVEEFLSADLRHQNGPPTVAVHAPQNLHVDSVYDALRAWRRGETLRKDVFDAAGRALADAEASARPVADYLLTQANSQVQRISGLLDGARNGMAQLEADAQRARVEAQEAQAEATRIRLEVEAARAEAEAAREDAEAARAEAAAVKAEAEIARSEAERASRNAEIEVKSARAVAEAARSASACSEMELTGAIGEIQSLREALARAAQSEAAAIARVEAIYASTTWRLLGPARRIGRKAPGLARLPRRSARLVLRCFMARAGDAVRADRPEGLF